MSREQIEAIRHDLGLDGPPYERYARWLGSAAHRRRGDGREGDTGRPARQPRLHALDAPCRERGAVSAHRADAAADDGSLILATIIGIPFGIVSAVKQYGKIDYLLTSLTMILISTPTFVLGLILIYVLGVTFRLLPIGGMADIGQAVLSSPIWSATWSCRY